MKTKSNFILYCLLVSLAIIIGSAFAVAFSKITPQVKPLPVHPNKHGYYNAQR